MSKAAPRNMLALAVLALTFERPMHPYEMAATLKQRHKHESIKLRYGTLYTVIELLTSGGLISPKETSRDGKRPERTVYCLTEAGRQRLQNWMRELVAEPAKEFPQFEAALSLLPVLPPEEAVGLLRQRAQCLGIEMAKITAQLVFLSNQSVAELVAPEDQVPAPLLRQKCPAIFLVECDFRLAMLKAELAFVEDLIHRITHEGWGPIELWRDMQAICEARYREARAPAPVAAMMPEAVTRADINGGAESRRS